MGGEWPTVTLDQLYSFSSGLSKPKAAFGSGYPFVSFKDVFHNTFLPQQPTELVQSTEKERATCSIRRGDVFLTRTSETQDELGMSSVALADIPHGTFNGFTKRLRPRSVSAVSPEFAGYLFRSPRFRSQVGALSSLSTRASLNNEMLSRLTVELPPLDTQIAIAAVLKPLDDKIELNRRLSETLESMARALFQSWFVDFDPVRTKAEGCDTGLPKDIADLFPDSFEDSELGEIPTGWGVNSFADTVEILAGGTPKTSVPSYWGGDIPWFSVADAPPDSQVWVVATEKQLTRSGLEDSSARLLPIGTTIISARGTVGRLALIGVPMAMNQSCYGLRGRSDGLGYYTYFVTRQLVDRLKQHAHGSVFDTITRATLAGVLVAVPGTGLAEAFGKVVSPMLEQIRIGVIESRRLGDLRDALLPPLMSGNLRVAGLPLLSRG